MNWKRILSPLYLCYQLLVWMPIVVFSTIIFFSMMIMMGTFADKDWWGYHCSVLWGKCIVYSSLLRVNVEYNTTLEDKQQYIIISNHQSAFDIFLMSAFLKHYRRWMMKRSLEKIPFFGLGCKQCGFVFVDKGNMADVRETYRMAREVLCDGCSLIIFPEGTRTTSGKVAEFSRTAFSLADEFQLPIIPVSINGTFEALPKGSYFLRWHPLKMIFHNPVYPEGKGGVNVKKIKNMCIKTILKGLDCHYKTVSDCLSVA